MGNWNFGEDGWFRTDIEIAIGGLDEQGLLAQKYQPIRLNGRRMVKAQVEAISRKVDADYACRNAKPEVIIVEDDEPDLPAEHAAAKARRRQHHAVARYYKVRRNPTTDVWDKRVAKRAHKFCLEEFAKQDCEADVIRKYRSTFSNAEPYTRRGMRDFHR